MIREQQTSMCERLKVLGYSRNKQIRLYGGKFDLTSDPIFISAYFVVVDGIEQKSGRAMRIRIPLNILNMVGQQKSAA